MVPVFIGTASSSVCGSVLEGYQRERYLKTLSKDFNKLHKQPHLLVKTRLKCKKTLNAPLSTMFNAQKSVRGWLCLCQGGRCRWIALPHPRCLIGNKLNKHSQVVLESTYSQSLWARRTKVYRPDRYCLYWQKFLGSGILRVP